MLVLLIPSLAWLAAFRYGPVPKKVFSAILQARSQMEEEDEDEDE